MNEHSIKLVEDALKELRQAAQEQEGIEVSTEELIETFNTYKKDSKGSDNWMVTELKKLPLQVLNMFTGFLNLSFQTVSNPHQSFISINSLLGKPDGGVRTICLTPMLYRMMCRIKKQHIRNWENENIQSYDTACKGSSALTAALVRNLTVEIVFF